jgi:dTDP-4-amino-4,6-dideoxygalactose transaminase
MSDRIPLLDLRAEYEPLKERILAVVADVLDGMRLYNGPYVTELEERFAAYCGTRHAIGVGSGTEALMLALWAGGIGPGDAVFVPAFGFVAAPEVAVLVGATPYFVDVEPERFNLDPASLEAAVAAARIAKLTEAGGEELARRATPQKVNSALRAAHGVIPVQIADPPKASDGQVRKQEPRSRRGPSWP